MIAINFNTWWFNCARASRLEELIEEVDSEVDESQFNVIQRQVYEYVV